MGWPKGFGCMCIGRPGPRGPQGPEGPQGERGSRGFRGPRGVQGPPGVDGESCYGESVPEGVLITCGEESYLARYGERGPEGPQGQPGIDGTSCFVEVIPEGGEITCGDDSFVLLHGEDGEQGTPGPRGEPGLPGPPGPAGIPGNNSNLHFFDANGQDLGIMIEWIQSPSVFIPEMDMIVRFSGLGRYQNRHIELRTIARGFMYAQENCHGTPYTSLYPLDYQGLFGENELGYYRIVPNSDPVEIGIQSYLDSLNNYQCRNHEREIVEEVIPLERIELPFDEPVMGPLRIGLSE